ncbi:MAG TPA: hypothetical protein VKE22_20650 [Haliangiales bacterium]|nr:hypothetical protein [Haliangiales bacterium]
MSANKTPLQKVKDLGGKEKLVDSLAKLLESDEDADGLKARLKKASNAKLLRLAEVGRTVKDKYGSKDKLVAKVAELYGRTKDKDYVTRLAKYSPAKLLDIAASLAKKAAKK